MEHELFFFLFERYLFTSVSKLEESAFLLE